MLKLGFRSPVRLIRSVSSSVKATKSSSSPATEGETTENTTSGRRPRAFKINSRYGNQMITPVVGPPSEAKGNSAKEWLAMVEKWLERPRKQKLDRHIYPQNPLFVKPVHIPISIKEKIVELHTSDPITHSYENLARQYSIEVGKVQAFVELDKIKKRKIAEGQVLQTERARLIEDLMQRGDDLYENPEGFIGFGLSQSPPNVHSTPATASSDSASIDSQVVTKIKRNQAAAVKRITEQSETRMVPMPTKTLSSDPTEANPRYSFVFVDTSRSLSHESRPVSIREKDGTLRGANYRERKKHLQDVYPSIRLSIPPPNRPRRERKQHSDQK